jgi:hypothetical protein
MYLYFWTPSFIARTIIWWNYVCLVSKSIAAECTAGPLTLERKSAPTILMLVLGLMLLVACGLWESYTTFPYSLFPRQIMLNVLGFTVILGVVFLVGVIYYAAPILWPEQIEVLYTTNLIHIGAYSMATGSAGALSGPPSGWFVKKVKNTRWLFTSFVLLLTAFSGLQAVVSKLYNLQRLKPDILIAEQVQLPKYNQQLSSYLSPS